MSIKRQINKEYVESINVLIFLFLITFVFLLQSPLHVWIGADADTDSSVFKTVALMMDKGYMPYRDTFDHKGPLLYIINWVGGLISSYRGVWVIEFVTLFVTFGGIYKIARFKCDKIFSCITLLVSVSPLFSYFEGGNLSEEYAMPLIAISLYIFLDYLINQKVNKLRLIVCGFCMGGVCLLRANMISVWIVFCVAIFVKCIFEKKYLQLREFIVFFLVGFFIVSIPIIAWLFVNNALQGFWEDYIQFNRAYTSVYGGKWKAFFTFFNKTVIIFTVIISVYLCKAKDKFLYGIYTCYLFISIWLICISGLTSGHYGMMLVPAIAFPIASLYDLCKQETVESTGKVITLLLTVYLLGVIVMPDWLNLVGSIKNTYDNRLSNHQSETIETICSFIDENTLPEETISVYGNWDIVYVRSNRGHATKYSYQFPIGNVNPGIMEEYWYELTEEMPKIIVIQRGHYDTNIISFLDKYSYYKLWSQNEDSLNDGAIVYIRQSKSIG